MAGVHPYQVMCKLTSSLPTPNILWGKSPGDEVGSKPTLNPQDTHKAGIWILLLKNNYLSFLEVCQCKDFPKRLLLTHQHRDIELLLYTHFVSYILCEMVGSFHSLRLLRLISYFSSTTPVPGESLPNIEKILSESSKKKKKKDAAAFLTTVDNALPQ